MRTREIGSAPAGRLSAFFLAALLLLPADGAKGEQSLVELRVVAREGGPALTDGVELEVWAREGKRAVRKVAAPPAAPARLQLAPDDYRVVARYRHARSVIDIAVARDGPTRETLNLRLGTLELELLPGPGADAVRRGVTWTVRPYRDGGATAKPIATTGTPVPELGLSAGWYKVTADHAARSYSHVVEVSAGRHVTYSLFMK
jgi:hypothetical protein